MKVQRLTKVAFKMAKLTRAHCGWWQFKGGNLIRKKYKVKCLYCGNEFETTHKNTKYCNTRCFNKMRYMNNVDKNVFETWNHDNAYMFGLIMSDGCLTHNKDRHMITINLNDKEVIELLHKYVNCKRKIYKNKKQYGLYYWNEDAVEYLRGYGLIENKSLIAKYPYNIPNEYQADFIRGVFDGDGSIVFHKTQWNTYPQVSIVTGSIDFAEGLVKILKDNNISSKIYTTNRTGNNNYYIRITKINEVKKFKEFIYKYDTVYKLNRKYQKFAELDYIQKIYSEATN